MLVYGIVALFVGAIVLALVFARPRLGMGAVKRGDVPGVTPSGQPWMPGGDIFGNEPQPEPEAPPAAAGPWARENDPWKPVHDPWQPAPPALPPPAVPPAIPPPAVAPAPPPVGRQPLGHDPWSTGAPGQPGPEPRWDKR